MSDHLPRKCCECNKLFIPIFTAQKMCVECIMDDEEECDEIDDMCNSLECRDD